MNGEAKTAVLQSMDMAVQVEMMNESALCIILKQMDYRDHDVILTVLTKEYGKLSLTAGGARKMTSKNAGSILPYTLAECSFDYRPDKTMFRLKTARTKNLYRCLHEDYMSSISASFLAEAADAFCLTGNESENVSKIYEDLLQCFDLIEKKENTDTVVSLFLVEMMKLFGIEPDVDECTRDGNQKVSAISIKDGGFLCRECAEKEGIVPSSIEDLKRFRLIVKGGLQNYQIIKDAGGAKKKDLMIITEMIQEHASIHFRSYELYNRFSQS